MEFNKYYQDELAFLREMGKEFAKAHPAIAPMLADRGSDPEVERLLEGFAFLTGKIRQKLDDEFPELVHGMMNLLAPHYLRPIPSMSIVEFSPISGAVRNKMNISRGVELASIPVEGTSCKFRTCYDVDLYPFGLENGSLETGVDGKSFLRLKFKMSPGVSTQKAGLESLRLHFSGDSAYGIYLWLIRQVSEIRLLTYQNGKPGKPIFLPSESILPVGFTPEESLIPYPEISFDGYRLLQEYFTFPEKFLFIKIENLNALSRLPDSDSFDLQFIFKTAPPPSLRVSRDNVRLFCTPVANLFSIESDPVRVNHQRVEYRLRPAENPPLHYEIFSIEKAKGWVRGSSSEQEYPPFYSFNHRIDVPENPKTYFQTRMKGAVVGDGTETYVSFVNGKQETLVPPAETVVFKLKATNRNLASKLRVGDIKIPTESSPEYARFQNICRVSSSIRPPLEGDLYWRLVSHLSLNYISLSNIESLRGILDLYNLQSYYDRQAGRANERRIEGIKTIKSEVENYLFKGSPVRGTAIHLEMSEEHFAGEGDMFIFATILNEFFSLYVSLNSYTRMTAREIQQGEVYQWKPKVGRQILF